MASKGKPEGGGKAGAAFAAFAGKASKIGGSDWECAIIGGGPAGLTAATYLGRFKRRVLLIDAGESRLQRIPLSHNVPGFPEGITGRDLLSRLQDQASRYGAFFRDGHVERIDRYGDLFRLTVGAETICARTVLLATGSELIEPAIPNIDAALARGFVRYCPICDGYEAEGQNIAVLGGRKGAVSEAHFLRTYSERVTYLWQGEGEPTTEERAQAQARGIRVAAASLTKLEVTDCVEATSGGASERYDVVYPCLGCGPQSVLARALGADLAPEGGVCVNLHQETKVKGFFAAGDVLQGLDQIASAYGHAAIASVAIHNRLREQMQQDGSD